MTTQNYAPEVMECVLYLRISDKAQERKGSGLASQEACCREYANFRGYKVDKIFREVLSGGSQDRPAMTELLKYLREHRKTGRVVIIDDISRFARDVSGHWGLREELKAAGGFLESPRIKFAEDADSVFNENILASVAQHQRQKNAEQTKSRMRGRVMNGFWPFKPPIGYRHERRSGQGMLLVRNEPLASVIQDGLQGFSSGRFRSQAEVKRFFESQPVFPKEPDGSIRFQYITDILKNPLYAGHVAAPKWDVSLRKGQHEPLISLEAFERNQKRISEAACAPFRADIDADFPLRGAVACADCGKPVTACWSRSQTGVKHAYYVCYTKGCIRSRKSLRRDKVEGAFASLLRRLAPSKQLVDLAAAMFKDAWDQRSTQSAAVARAHEAECLKIDKQIAGLLDRVVEANNSTVIRAYEERIATLEREKLVMKENSPIARYRRRPSSNCSNSPLASSQTLTNSGNQAISLYANWCSD